MLVSLSPVDPLVQQYVGAVPNVSMEQREKIAEYWGLDKPPLERFSFRGRAPSCTGISAPLPGIYRRPVLDIIGEKFPALSGADADSLGLFLESLASPSAASWEIFMENGRIKFSKSCA